jgi:hypothetical protein
MNIDWVKSIDSNNNSIISLENRFRVNAIISSADIIEDKVYQKLDYRTNFSVDNEDVNDEVNKIVKNKPCESINSLILLDNEYFLIQYISKHIQQYKIKSDNIPKYIKYLTWISDASEILSNRLKLPKITKPYSGDLIKRTYDFCPHRSNCQINYGSKKGKCCAPHYIHNLVTYDLNMLIKYLEKNKEGSAFVFEQEVFKILKHINTIQFIINQMYLELASFKNYVVNNEIEKYHHNCKIEDPKINNNRKFAFSDPDVAEVFHEEVEEVECKRTNMNVYREWK